MEKPRLANVSLGTHFDQTTLTVADPDAQSLQIYKIERQGASMVTSGGSRTLASSTEL